MTPIASAWSPGGLLERLAGTRELIVNSLHAQGIDRLAPALVVEAEAPDGQIEAVRHRSAPFVVGVQWHPEYRVLDNAFGRALFAAFGAACRGVARRRGDELSRRRRCGRADGSAPVARRR